MSELVNDEHLRVMQEVLTRETPSRTLTALDIRDLSVTALIVARELGDPTLSEVHARRRVQIARENLDHQVRLMRILAVLAFVSAGEILAGITLAQVVNGYYTWLTVVAGIACVVLTGMALFVFDEGVRKGRAQMRRADWDYEDAVMRGFS